MIESDAELFVAKTVLLELEWVLRGAYGFARSEVLRALEHLLGLPNLRVEDRAAVDNALANLRDGFDFADGLHHSSSRTCEALLTFDTRRFANRARRKALTPPRPGACLAFRRARAPAAETRAGIRSATECPAPRGSSRAQVP